MRESYDELVKKHFPSTQVVEVKYKNSQDKTYSYVGSGNLRAGQRVDAPVTHHKSGKNYIAPGATVVATHRVVGAKVGDKIGFNNSGGVGSIPKPLKYLPGAKETQQNRQINVNGLDGSVNDYLKAFKGGKA